MEEYESKYQTECKAETEWKDASSSVLEVVLSHSSSGIYWVRKMII